MRFLKLAVLTSLSISAAVLSAQTIQINRENKTIAISTTDEATATADIAAITVGFEIFGPDSEKTYAQAGHLSEAILGALHKAGVDDKKIESSSQQLLRNTAFDEKEPPEQRAKELFTFKQSWEVSVPAQSAAPGHSTGNCRRREQDWRHRLAPFGPKSAPGKSSGSRLGQGTRSCFKNGRRSSCKARRSDLRK